MRTAKLTAGLHRICAVFCNPSDDNTTTGFAASGLHRLDYIQSAEKGQIVAGLLFYFSNTIDKINDKRFHIS